MEPIPLPVITLQQLTPVAFANRINRERNRRIRVRAEIKGMAANLLHAAELEIHLSNPVRGHFVRDSKRLRYWRRNQGPKP